MRIISRNHGGKSCWDCSLVSAIDLDQARRSGASMNNSDVQSESSFDIQLEANGTVTSDYHSSVSDISDIVKESVQGNLSLTPIQLAERSGQLRDELWCVQQNTNPIPDCTSLPTCDSPLQVKIAELTMKVYPEKFGLEISP